jgi:hypothetical protein
MPIRWSALKVSEAMDMAEEFVNKAAEPLEQARIVVREARNIANLPKYVDDRLVRILGEIERAIGGSQWEPIGRLRSGIKAVRDSIPKEAKEEERAKLKNGTQQALVI